jgi:hypothetical protein
MRCRTSWSSVSSTCRHAPLAAVFATRQTRVMSRVSSWLHSSLALDGVCRAAILSSRAGGLLHHRFNLTLRRFIFCCTFRQLHACTIVVSLLCGSFAAQPLAGILPCNARTFLTLALDCSSGLRDHAPFQAGSVPVFGT